MSHSKVTIELTPTQVDSIVRGVSERDFATDLLRRLADGTNAVPRREELDQSPRLSQSLLLGLLVLASFPSDGRSLSVGEVARGLGMRASTTHRYMTTLLAVGLLAQDPRTRRYRVPTDG